MNPDEDPFGVLGIGPTVDEAEIRRAWRRVARVAHPDAGGSDASMQRANLALERALSLARGGPAVVEDGSRGPRGAGGRHRDGSSRVRTDVSSFTISVPPVESFMAMEIVAAEMGSLIHDDPPRAIEFTLHQSSLDEGGQSWCRCELVPEAGGTTVHISVGSEPASSAPSVDAVRDMLVAALNSIDWPGQGERPGGGRSRRRG